MTAFLKCDTIYRIVETQRRRILKSGKLQPNSRNCFICGLENPVGLQLRFQEIAPGKIETTYTAPDDFQGYPGVLHGGIVATILDETSGRAFGGTKDDPRFMFTAKLEVVYRKNVPIGKLLRIVGKAVKDKGRSAEGWAGIYDAETDDLLAEGKTILVNVPAEKLADMSDNEKLGWKVYPEE